MALPPGPPQPAWLTTARILMDPAWIWGQAQRYGETFTIRTVTFGTEVIVTRPATIREVLTGDPDTYSAADANKALGFVLGDRSLLLLDGPPHVRQRKLALPPFTGDRLAPYADVMRDVTARAIRALRVGEVVPMMPLLQRITLDVILGLVLGVTQDSLGNRLRAALIALVDRAQSPLGLLWMTPSLQRLRLPIPTPWSVVKKQVEQTDALLYEHIEARRRLPREGRPNDVLDMLLDAKDEEGRPMAKNELRDQLVTLLVAGHETTATSLAWVLEEVLHTPGEARKLREEALSVTGGGPLSSEHVPRLVRTDSVVREALRLYPVTGAVGRTLRKPVVLEGYEIPAGVMIAPNFSLLHRRPEIYPDPHTFQPERFIGKKVDPYEWMPFGAGAHRCLGMHFALFEMKVILASLFAEAEIEAVSPNKALVGLRSFVLSPKGNTPVRVKNIYQPVDLSAARPADAPSLRFRSSNTPSILRSGSRSGA